MDERCPLCHKKIIALQINFEEAVRLCESPKCPWPFGHQDIQIFSRDIKTLAHRNIVKGDSQKSKETIRISTELSLYTPPVTPSGEGSSKDSVKSETLIRTSPTTNLMGKNINNSPTYDAKSNYTSPKYSTASSPGYNKKLGCSNDYEENRGIGYQGEKNPALRSIFDIDSSVVLPPIKNKKLKSQGVESNICDTRDVFASKSDKLVVDKMNFKTSNGIHITKVETPGTNIKIPIEYGSQSKKKKFLVSKQNMPNSQIVSKNKSSIFDEQKSNTLFEITERPLIDCNQQPDTLEKVPKKVDELFNQQKNNNSSNSEFNFHHIKMEPIVQSRLLQSEREIENNINLNEKSESEITCQLSSQSKDSSLLENGFEDLNYSTNNSTMNFDLNNTILDELLAGGGPNTTQDISEDWLDSFLT